MTVKEIVKKYLEDNGYDGLCKSQLVCGCEIDDLMCCQEDGSYCVPGHKEKPTKDNYEDYLEDFKNPEWVIVPGKSKDKQRIK